MMAQTGAEEEIADSAMRGRIALNETVALDIATVLQTKLLIQANSGGGKPI